MSNIIGQAHKLGKQNRKWPDMASSMLLTDASTPICPNTQLSNIEGIDTSVTTDTLLRTINADVLEEFSECDKYLVVVLQLLGTSCSCYKNICITKLWAPGFTFSIYNGIIDTVYGKIYCVIFIIINSSLSL